MDESTRWQLTRLLTLNHFTQGDGLHTLKQTLKLYAFSGATEVNAIINALLELEFEQLTGRVTQKGKVGFAHGVKIILTASDQILPQEQIFLLGSVLSVYFAQYAEVNIYTQLELPSFYFFIHSFSLSSPICLDTLFSQVVQRRGKTTATIAYITPIFNLVAYILK